MAEMNEMDSPVFELLALGVERVEPRPALRARILSAAARPAEVIPIRRMQPPSRLWRMPFAAVSALVVVALAAGLVAGDLIGRGTTPPPVQQQVTRFALQGHGPMDGVTATVVELKSDGVAFVSFSGLPQLPPTKVYELWLITPSSHADAAGVFVPDSNGGKVLVVSTSLSGYNLMAVTVEAGPSGVSSPTQQPQIYGTVS